MGAAAAAALPPGILRAAIWDLRRRPCWQAAFVSLMKQETLGQSRRRRSHGYLQLIIEINGFSTLCTTHSLM
jgi:hypothetical protein